MLHRNLRVMQKDVAKETVNTSRGDSPCWKRRNLCQTMVIQKLTYMVDRVVNSNTLVTWGPKLVPNGQLCSGILLERFISADDAVMLEIVIGFVNFSLDSGPPARVSSCSEVSFQVGSKNFPSGTSAKWGND